MAKDHQCILVLMVVGTVNERKDFASYKRKGSEAGMLSVQGSPLVLKYKPKAVLNVEQGISVGISKFVDFIPCSRHRDVCE